MPNVPAVRIRDVADRAGVSVGTVSAMAAAGSSVWWCSTWPTRSSPTSPRASRRSPCLEPGAAEAVTFRLGARDLSYWSTAHSRWLLSGGTFELVVGASSRA